MSAIIPEIVRRREEAGLTQHQVSRIAGLPGNALNRIERGESKRTHSLRAREIARALNCNVSDVFTEIEIKKEQITA